MKSCFKRKMIVLIIAFLIAVIVFALLLSGFMLVSELFFIITISISLLILISMFITSAMLVQIDNHRAYCQCGEFITIGATVTFILSLFTLMSLLPILIINYILISLIFFFMTLMLGGSWCFLACLNSCHKHCYCCNYPN